ncbi:hypothetical protein JZU46_06505, partial [bacterium]|nr:hypothetical protein [bacterium]
EALDQSGIILTTTKVNAADAKTTPSDSDVFPLLDSSASYGLKKSSWANVKAALKTYFDTLYPLLSGGKVPTSQLGSGTANSGSYLRGDQTWATVAEGREKLTANRTYYVRTDGNDANTGLANTSGGAFLTIQKAVDVAASLDTLIYNVTIQISAGTYASPITCKQCVGAGTVTIIGNETTPANVVTNGGGAFHSKGIQTKYIIKGIKGTGTGSFVNASMNSAIEFQNCEIANTGQQIRAEDGGIITATGNYEIVSGASSSVAAVGGGVIRVQGRTITLINTPAFSIFCDVNVAGKIFFNSNTFIGSATGIRYYLQLNSVCLTNGAGPTYIPGNTDGVSITGGQYA